MSVLSSAQFLAYAQEQIRAADLIVAGHAGSGPLCRCGRVLPCSVALSLAARRSHFVAVLARRAASPAVGRARLGSDPVKRAAHPPPVNPAGALGASTTSTSHVSDDSM